jgi:hypothetical protein
VVDVGDIAEEPVASTCDLVSASTEPAGFLKHLHGITSQATIYKRRTAFVFVYRVLHNGGTFLSCCVFVRLQQELRETTQTLYILCNVEVHLLKYCYCGEAVSIKYSVCVCVCVCILTLCSRNANHMFFCGASYCPLWPVWLYHAFPHYLINGMNSGGGIIEYKIVF